MGDEELRAAVAEAIRDTGATSPRELGKVMGVLMKRFPGRLDGTRARRAAEAALKAPGGSG